jgi:hypothetical protein
MALALAPIIPRDFGPRNSLGAASWLVPLLFLSLVKS